jgi:shikimate kinase/3-dehydroquinate synthase
MHLSQYKNIYLTGFMATGKSRVGAQVASELEWKYVDSDHFIEDNTGQTVSEIFAEHGEEYFRRMEFEAIKRISQESSQIIALGGGSLKNPEIYQLIQKDSLLICLWAPEEIISERIGRKESRPLMAGLSDEERLQKIRAMIDERKSMYNLADFHMDGSDARTIEKISDQLIHKLKIWEKRSILVHPSETAPYPIFIGKNLCADIDEILNGLHIQSEFLVVSDANVAKKQFKKLNLIKEKVGNCKSFVFNPGEQFKNLQTLNRLYSFMLRRGYTRSTTLLQFGGGVVGDMAGFGAATYQRGIPFIQIPTTLLSMVDSSVGGKVAVNHPEGKNMIGAFYQPKAVIIDTEVLSTLSDTEYISGLAEVVKYGVIYDEDFFSYLEANAEKLIKRDHTVLIPVIQKCCQIKAEVVGQDERETGIRAILNFGHTFGHAIEKLTDYTEFSHGIAVGLGMRVASRVSVLTGRWSESDHQRMCTLLNKLDFPKFYNVDKAAAWQAMAIDKKAEKGKRNYILPIKMGQVEKVSNVEQNIIDQAWDEIRETP